MSAPSPLRPASRSADPGRTPPTTILALRHRAGAARGREGASRLEAQPTADIIASRRAAKDRARSSKRMAERVQTGRWPLPGSRPNYDACRPSRASKCIGPSSASPSPWLERSWRGDSHGCSSRTSSSTRSHAIPFRLRASRPRRVGYSYSWRRSSSTLSSGGARHGSHVPRPRCLRSSSASRMESLLLGADRTILHANPAALRALRL